MPKWWNEGQGSSKTDQRVRKRRSSMQAAKQSEDCVSSPQPPEMEDESSQTKTAKRSMLVCRDDVVPWLVRVQRFLVLMLGELKLSPSMVPFSPQEQEKVLPPSLLLLLALVLALVLTLLSWCWTGRSSSAHGGDPGVYVSFVVSAGDGGVVPVAAAVVKYVSFVAAGGSDAGAAGAGADAGGGRNPHEVLEGATDGGGGGDHGDVSGVSPADGVGDDGDVSFVVSGGGAAGAGVASNQREVGTSTYKLYKHVQYNYIWLAIYILACI